MESDVVLASPRPLGTYFLAKDTVVFDAPVLERSPLKTRPLSFIEVARIRSI